MSLTASSSPYPADFLKTATPVAIASLLIKFSPQGLTYQIHPLLPRKGTKCADA